MLYRGVEYEKFIHWKASMFDIDMYYSRGSGNNLRHAKKCDGF